MAEIQYEEQQQYQRASQAEQKPFLVRLVLATGIVSTDRAAEYVLLGVAGLAIIVAAVLYFSSGSSVQPQPPTPFQEGKLI